MVILFQCVAGTTPMVNCSTAAGQQPKSSCHQGMFLYVRLLKCQRPHRPVFGTSWQSSTKYCAVVLCSAR